MITHITCIIITIYPMYRYTIHAISHSQNKHLHIYIYINIAKQLRVNLKKVQFTLQFTK